MTRSLRSFCGSNSSASEPPRVCRKLVSVSLAVTGLENGDVTPFATWGSKTYAEGRGTRVGIA